MTARQAWHTALIALLLSFGPAAQGWTLKDTAGVRYTSPAPQGKWVLVNFWAPWCPVCIHEMPEFSSLQQAHSDLQVIGVAVMYKSRTEVMGAAKGLGYPIVIGSEDTAADFGGIVGLPTSLLYAPDGKLVGRHAGELSRAQVEQAMDGKAAALFTR